MDFFSFDRWRLRLSAANRHKNRSVKRVGDLQPNCMEIQREK